MWFQSLPEGEMAVVYWEEDDDPRRSLQEFAASDDPFDQWLKEPARTLEDDQEVFEGEVD